MNNLEVTLLSQEEIIKSGFTKEGCPTGYADILGAECTTLRGYYWCKDDIKNKKDNNEVTIWNYKIKEYSKLASSRSDIAIRPAIKFSSIEHYVCNIFTHGGVIYGMFGEYPQYVLNENFNILAETAYQNGLLKPTGKVYTTDHPHVCGKDHVIEEHEEFKPYQHIEYEYKGEKYIRVTDYKPFRCNIVFPKPPYWIKVEPIVWELDPKNDIAITFKGIISNIQYNYELYEGVKSKNKDISFEETALYKYLNQYFVKEMLPESLLKFLDNTNYKTNDYNDMISKKFK